MIVYIGIFQLSVFAGFFVLERAFPARKDQKPSLFTFWWLAIVVFSIIWLRGILIVWPFVEPLFVDFSGSNPIAVGFLFYLLYSFINYWVHRLKHSNKFLWRHIHILHHSPSHMESRISFYRHPFEIVFNTLLIFFFGRLLFGLSIESILIVLAIEGSLECFHHSNIKINKKFYSIGKIIQLPHMHLVHHELGAHKHNYAPFLWDWVFKTIYVPTHWNKRLGFKNSNSVPEFLWRKKRC